MVPFTGELELNGKTATGVEVPAAVVEDLGGGKRPAVVASFAGHSYRTTLGVMAGRVLLPVSAEQRAAAGVSAGDVLDVTLELDTAPREVEVPEDLAALLHGNPVAGRAFASLPPSGRKRLVLAVTGAKTDETRRRRLGRVLAELDPAAG